MNPDYLKYIACIQYWRARKVRWPLAVFFIFHNYACQMKIEHYRHKIARLRALEKMEVKGTIIPIQKGTVIWARWQI